MSIFVPTIFLNACSWFTARLAFGGIFPLCSRAFKLATNTSTALADLLTLPLAANPFLAMRASLWWSSREEFENGVAYADTA